MFDSRTAPAETDALAAGIAALKPTPAHPGSYAVSIALLLLLAVLWSASYAFVHLIVESIPPVTTSGSRALLAGILLYAVMRFRRAAIPRDAATQKQLVLQSFLGSIIPLVLIAWAQTTVEVNVAVILSSTSPIFAFFITWGITRHEPATARKLLGVFAGLAGICLIVGASALGGIGRGSLAQLALLGAACSYACSAIFGRNFDHLDPIVPAACTLLIAACLLLPAGFIIDRPWTLSPSATSLLALAGLAVFSTALAAILYFTLLRRIGSIGVTSQSYLRIPIGVMFGVVFFGEALPPTTWLGLACVVVGVIAMTMPERKAKPKPLEPPA